MDAQFKHKIFFICPSHFFAEISMPFTISMYPSIKAAFPLNPKLEALLNNQYADNEEYFKILEDLFKELINGNCSGIKEKVGDANSINKFHSCIAELYIGRLFLRNKCQVEFLPDNYSSQDSPDLAVSKNGTRVLVEVMRVGDGPVLDTLLDDLFNYLKGKPFRVDIDLDGYMSIPPIGYVEINKAINDVQASLDELKLHFPTQLGKFTVNTPHITYHVQSISGQDGYPGIIKGTTFGAPVKKFTDHMKYYAIKKAGKRTKFSVSDKRSPYVVAFVSELQYMDAILFREEIYGRVMGYPDHDLKEKLVIDDYTQQVRFFKSTPEWKRIEAAEICGWGPLLKNVHLIPNDMKYVSQLGWYLTEPVLENISAIIYSTSPERNSIFPNPFADPIMNGLYALKQVGNLGF